LNEAEVKKKKKNKKKAIGYYLWCLVGILAAIPVIFEIRLGVDKIAAINKAVSIVKYLEHPETIEFYAINELNIHLDNAYIESADGEDITEYAKSLLGDAPLLTYVIYGADDRNGMHTELEVFFYKDGQPIGSVDIIEKSESLTTTLEFQSEITEDDYEIMRCAFLVLVERDGLDGTILIVEKWELDGQLALLWYILALVALSVIVFAINLILSKKSR
jgi:hypothetical protein